MRIIKDRYVKARKYKNIVTVACNNEEFNLLKAIVLLGKNKIIKKQRPKRIKQTTIETECVIYSTLLNESFKLTVHVDNLDKKCKQIWMCPEYYYDSLCSHNSKIKFLNNLYVSFPDGSVRRLKDIILGK